MKKLFSRQLSLVLALMVACSMVCSLQVSAYEDYYSTAYDYDQNFAYDYALLDDDTVKITKATAYYDANLDYTLPQTLDGRTVSEVGEYAFRGCNLKSLTLNYQVKIDSHAFDFCFSNYNTDSYTGYGEYGYSYNYRCTKFWQPVNFPCGTMQIDSGAFGGCRFVNFTIPEGVETIGSFAFSACDQLAYIRIPNSVTSIEEGAFDGCSSLLDIYFYGTEEEWNDITVDPYMNSCFAQAEVTFVNDENKDDPAISEDTTYNKFAYVYDVPPYENVPRNMVTVNAYLGDTSADTVTIPSKINGFRVGAVGANNSEVFGLSYSINTVVIPDGVSILGNRSFAGTWLKNLYLPSGLAYIEESAFENCNELKTVYFGGSEEDWNNITIAEGNECLTSAHIVFDGFTDETLFSYNDNYGYVTITGYNGTQPNVVIPEQIDGKPVREIGASAFENRTDVKSVTIPEDVYYIGEKAFAGSGITSMELPNYLSSIDGYAFADCADLTTISIPAGVYSICSHAFDGSGLRSVTLSEGLRTIDFRAFINCTYLESLTVPSTVEGVLYSFENCPCLRELKVDPANTTYTSRDSNGNECNVIIDKANSEVIVGCGRSVIPSGVKKIGMYAFYNCTSLGMHLTDTQFTLPDTLEEIDAYSFYGCTSLKNINIPLNVKTISDCAFYGSGLTSIEIPERTEGISWRAFANC